MGRKYLYIPRNLRGGMDIHETLVPFNSAYPITRQNAFIVPAFAHDAGIQLPVTSDAAQLLKQWNVPGSIVQLPQVDPEEKKSSGWNLPPVNFNSIASIISKIVLDVLDGYNRRNEPLWRKAFRLPAMITQAYTDNPGPVSKSNFLQKAAPVIGTIANTFLPGTGSLLKSGLTLMGSKALPWIGKKILGSGGGGSKYKLGKRLKNKEGRSIQKGPFIFNSKTRDYLGKRVSFGKDLTKATDEAFRDKVKDNHWRKVITSAFTSAIKAVAPAIGSGRLLLGRKINLKNIKKCKKMKGGSKSSKDHMAWVRSFIGKKKGKGRKRGGRVKHRTSKGLTYIGAGKRRRHHKRGGSRSKLKIYQSHSLYYAKPPRKHKRKSKSGRGRGLVSSGFLGKGDPRNFSGWPQEWW